MSENTRYRWRTRAEARRQEYLGRVQDTTSRYVNRFQSLLDDLVRQGLEEFLPAEFSSVRSRLATVRSLLSTDPERARQLNTELGAEISSLPAMARTARREFEERERRHQQELMQMRQQARSELARFLQDQLALFTDPIERDFAFDQLKALQAEFGNRDVQPEELAKIRADLQRRVETIRAQATQSAQSWKASKTAEIKEESQQTLIDLHRQELAQDVDKHPKALQAVLDTLQTMRQQAVGPQSCSDAELQQRLSEAMTTADEAVVDENCRRATVRAVLAALQKAGFVTGKPQRQVAENDEVVIVARKPAGAEATFRVTVDGGLTYKFDHYEGMKCKADIDQVLPLLQEVYGIELSDKRVLWQNPDRISKSEKPMDEGDREQHSGY